MTACLDPVDVDRPLDKAFVINGVDPVEDLGTIGGPFSFAFGINASGTIVGESTIDTLSSTRHAFRIPSGGSMQRLIPTDTESVAFDINDSGQIVGHIIIAQGTQARGFVWTPAGSPQLQILPTLAGNQAQAFAINNSGVAVGVSQPAVGEFHAVLWNASGAIQDLGTLGITTKFAEAHDINSTGVVVGLTRNASNQLRAFRWTAASAMVELPAPWGGFASANAINSAGQIVGEATSASGPVHAVSRIRPARSLTWIPSAPAEAQREQLRMTASSLERASCPAALACSPGIRIRIP
jgi:probable HAF family extracellular repeat protein